LRDRIVDLHEHYRHDPGGLLDRRQVDRGHGQDHVGRQCDQLRRIGLCEPSIASVPANIGAEIFAFGPAQLAESLHERRHIRLVSRIDFGAVHKHGNSP
jgi:hypothetical protein